MRKNSVKPVRPVRWSKIIYAILKRGTMGNFHVKLYDIWTSGSGGYVVRKVYGRTHDGRTTDARWTDINNAPL